VDGHDLSALLAAFSVPPRDGKPTVIIASTVKGRGLPYLENDLRSHFVKFNERERDRAMKTLERDAEGTGHE
jgi:transketolase